MIGDIKTKPATKEYRSGYDAINWNVSPVMWMDGKRYAMLKCNDLVQNGDEVLSGYLNRETGGFWHKISSNNFGKKVCDTHLQVGKCRRRI